MANVMITLPQTVRWEDYERELLEVADGNSHLNFRVPSLPKDLPLNSKCFVVHKGLVRGWMYVSGLLVSDGFTCSTTGAYWPAGKYIQRSGKFYPMIDPCIQQKGFQGWRYTYLTGAE